MRSTLQNDSPYYRGRIAPYNVKHGLVDPSHTMTFPESHHTKRNMDFMDYTRKDEHEHNSREL
jgi:hypothetical protein